ncbi:hypothetical protein BC831DRAFT_463386 [Entophlyctis helioformis]|nr:hypothetical protein BC831DRAFT_463386 [Entophlyctis helioformis]
MHHHGSPLNRPESATPRETLAKREMPETAQQKHPRSSLVFHLAFNTAGSVLVMTAIAYVIQYCQDTLAAHPDAFPRFPILRSPAAPRPNPLTCFAGMAVLFGIAMAVMGITISNPLPSSIASYLGRLALTVMVYDLGIYIVHSMQHTVPAAIQFHKIHHRVPLFAWDVINADHADFLEAFLPILIVPWLFSFNIVEVWVLTFVLEVHGAITHSGCSIPALDKLDFVLVGPRFHAVHHVMHKNNYGVLFTLWDQIFGTAVPVAEADQRLWRRASSDTVPSM